MFQATAAAGTGGAATGLLDAAGLPARGRYGRTLEVMDALKATLKDEVDSCILGRV